MNQQLSLPIHQIDEHTFENFYANNNLLLLNSLHQNWQQIQQQFFYIWGAPGCGKSHLLCALCNQYLNEQRAAIYVPLNKSHYFSPAVLENLEQQEVVCLDDLQAVIGEAEWEMALFDLFNRIKAGGRTLLLISATVSPSALKVQLPDLASRLKWGEIYQLTPLTDTQKLEVLQENARRRGIELPAETAQFLLKRLDRDMHTLLQTLAKLDKASLQAQRNLTIPFVKETLGL